jgi:hypothetical protein
VTDKEALKLALDALKESQTDNDTMEFWDRKTKAITACEKALAASVQVFDHVTAARQGLRDAQNRSRQISNLINCGTCGYPLAPEERTSLIERDGVMVKPAPVQEPVATLLLQSKQNFERNFGSNGYADWIYADLTELMNTTPPQNHV